MQWRYIAGFLLIFVLFPAGRPNAQPDEDAPGGMRTFVKKTERAFEQKRRASSGVNERKSPGRFNQAPPFAVTGWKTAAFAADAHAHLADFPKRSCASCHSEQASGRHTTRARLACVQCHGRGVIPGNYHFSSPINPARRHALCARCHAGATASFAAYVVHEPPPGAADTAKAFPSLFWAFWAMVALAVATFGLFVPHAALWGIRECLELGQNAKEESP